MKVADVRTAISTASCGGADVSRAIGRIGKRPTCGLKPARKCPSTRRSKEAALSMPIKSYRPTTPTRRFQTVVSREDITKQTPEKIAGRGQAAEPAGATARARVSSRFIGGGHKQAYRDHRFQARQGRRCRRRSPSIEYDPNRSARIALLHYVDGEKRYILAPVGLEVGRTVQVGSGSRHSGGQCAAAEEYPGRHRSAQHRTAAGQGRRRWRARRARRRSWFRKKAASRC